ncbi:class C beta-lactamase-related serine hydrolase [Lacihabitans sp. CCS-44]|uniref:serine hydrolase domain-containing protein n=1 Tax=Lacihabitans sp. CCS-44 TaxID=2487331 RepID=UPI0020CE3095|nr:serine hydrolase [Lacihabitans sp. CCS-44]MCP9754056.1 class C beta-lactamase-related serine hydrolase [Lacihabitans sp. CCS-44]
MSFSRRSFVKTLGVSTIGLSALPILNSFRFPAEKFLRKSPESQGVSSESILNFLAAVRKSGIEWHSFMLLRHGNVVAEAWWKPFEVDYKHTLYSLSKSFTSSAIGFLVDEGKVSVNDKVISFFPNDLPAEISANLKAMTIKHLLTMNTGHKTDTMPVLRQKEPQTWVKSFLQHPVVFEPSTHFLYNTGATYMLGAILHKVTGKTLEEYLKARLFVPLGIENYDWEKSPEGLNTAGFGLRVGTEDIAKFGQLYLQKGKWNGKQLISEKWIEEATSKQTTSQAGDNDWSQGYGYQFWRCKPGFYRGDGAYGQFCMVIPEQDAVLVMTSESFDLQKSMNIAYENLLPGFLKDALPENPELLKKLKNEIQTLSLPVTKSKTFSPLMAKYSDKRFKMDKNPYGISEMGFGLFPDAGVVRFFDNKEIKKMGFGWEKWQVNKNGVVNRFPIPYRTQSTSKIAATATWLNDNTLQINMKFVEAVHGDKMTVVFEGDKVTINLLSSISENAKNTPETRVVMTGVMVG